MTEAPSPSRQAADRIGQHLKRGLGSYYDHWQEWMAPVLVAGAIVIVSFLCCWLPYFIVIGPITCGLYCCALRGLRGGSVAMADLHRGWTKPLRAIVASVVIHLGTALPMILLYVVFAGFFGLVIALAPEPAAQARAPDLPPAPGTIEAGPPEQTGDEGQPASPAAARQHEEPSAALMLAMIAGMLVFYGLLFLVIILSFLWSLWFATRTMFALPLIADRGLGAVESLRRSWRETRVGFWELLVINFVTTVLGVLGMYAMYVGLIFTVPIGLTIIAAVYEERFAKSEPISDTAT